MTRALMWSSSRHQNKTTEPSSFWSRRSGDRLDQAKERFVSAFVDNYLILDDGERRLFDEELQAMPTDEREDVMGFTNSWIEEGRVEGRAEEREENRRRWATMALSQLHRRVGMIPDALGARVEVLPIEGLERLGVDLLDFSTLADLEGWLDRG